MGSFHTYLGTPADITITLAEGATVEIKEEETNAGPGFTLDDIAKNLSITYESAKSMHRTAGRTARKWREDTATEPPIDLIDTDEYGWKSEYGGDRTVYRLPEGVAEILMELTAR